MFVAISCFAVANDKADDVRAAFHARPHLVDDAPGFVRMEVLQPVEDDDEFWLLTYWQDESSFRTWHASHAYRESHTGIPKGLKLARGRTSIRHFRHLCS